MVDFTEPIFQLIDSSLAQMLTFDTSGIELFVTENNPKTLNALIKKLITFYKDKPDVDPHKMAYSLMPSQAAYRIKWCCPKVHMVKGQWVCDCTDPCTTAKKGKTTYTYENMEFRMFPGIQRDSPEWIALYKIRTSIE